MTPFVRPRPVEQPALRLIGFHHAGGSASVYYPMSRQLPQDWDLVLLDLPGRGKRHGEQPLHDMEQLIQLAVADVQPWLDAPFAIFGHSLGAILAVEVARRLQAQGSIPSFVTVSGRAAPVYQAQVCRGLHELEDEELLAELLALGGTPERIREVPGFVERFLRISRADLRAVESYRPSAEREPLGCPIIAFGGIGDAWAPLDMVLAWEKETSGDFHSRFFPGGHFYFLGEPFAGFTRQLVTDARELVPVAA